MRGTWHIDCNWQVCGITAEADFSSHSPQLVFRLLWLEVVITFEKDSE